METFKEIYFRGFKFSVGSLGNVKYLNQDKLRTLHRNSSGYVSFTKGNKIFLVHRMIAIAFIPNPENKPFVNHINGDKTDNRVQNLEWVTKKENEYHSVHILGNKRNVQGLKANWENPIHAKKVQATLPNGDVKIYKSQSECAKDLKVSRSYISAVLKNVIKKNPYKLINK
jgi:hypothetical protein